MAVCMYQCVYMCVSHMFVTSSWKGGHGQGCRDGDTGGQQREGRILEDTSVSASGREVHPHGTTQMSIPVPPTSHRVRAEEVWGEPQHVCLQLQAELENN